MKKRLFYLLIILGGVLIQACTTPRELRYLQGSFDTAALRNVVYKSQTIQKNDQLSIVVYSDNPVATARFNQTVGATAAVNIGTAIGGEINPSSAALPSGGYLVSNDGNIEFPEIGRLHVEGLTKDQLVDLLNSKLADTLLKHPYYSIRFLNFKITMVGEVNRPGMYTIPSERVNIIEAIGMAGDLTFYGLRNNIMVIRESNGQRQFGHLDITNPAIFNSPFFYLQQNDVVIVDLNKRKVSANDNQLIRNVSLAGTIVSTFAILISILRR
ncbi:MAG: polysaccharide biosynthesis/export family protein [Williamsia sp.]|nr:polysaccharide biosynthesis/export family protein [Williamsia sp.]